MEEELTFLKEKDQLTQYDLDRAELRYQIALKEINLNVVMIAHQKATLSSKEPRNHDVMSLGKEKFDELVFLDFFEAFEFKKKINEIFNKNYNLAEKCLFKMEKISNTTYHEIQVVLNLIADEW